MEIILLFIIVLILLFGKDLVLELIGAILGLGIIAIFISVGLVILVLTIFFGIYFFQVIAGFIIPIAGFIYSAYLGIKSLNYIEDNYKDKNIFIIKVLNNRLGQLLVGLVFLFSMLFVWRYISIGILSLFPETL